MLKLEIFDEFLNLEISSEQIEKITSYLGYSLKENYKILYITNLGDCILKDEKSSVYILNISSGEVYKIGDSVNTIVEELKMDDYIEEVFSPDLIKDLTSNLGKLNRNKCFSMKTPIFLGGGI